MYKNYKSDSTALAQKTKPRMHAQSEYRIFA